MTCFVVDDESVPLYYKNSQRQVCHLDLIYYAFCSGDKDHQLLRVQLTHLQLLDSTKVG